MPELLLLEDDFKLASEIAHFLDHQRLDCEVIYDGRLFMKQIKQADYALYILDINVPGINGLEVCRQVRKEDPRTPILMLTAYSSVSDKVEALESGADDYLMKPFHLDELLARIKALLRRAGISTGAYGKTYTVGDLVINAADMSVLRAGVPISLTPKEYKLLELLAINAGRPVSKQTIAEQVWDIHFETGTNTIEVYISFLRNKVDKGFGYPLIHTRAGFGYYIKETR